MTVFYVVIAVIVGLVAAVLFAKMAIDDLTIGEVEFGDFLFGSVVGILIGAAIGSLWIFTVPLAALIFGAWRLFLAMNSGPSQRRHSTNKVKSKSSSSWLAGLFKVKK